MLKKKVKVTTRMIHRWKSVKVSSRKNENNELLLEPQAEKWTQVKVTPARAIKYPDIDDNLGFGKYVKKTKEIDKRSLYAG